MPPYHATGLVLRRTLLGENDKILTLLTREHGKLRAVAKGARRPGSRLSGVTEPFTVSRFYIASARSLDIVTQCEIIEAFSDLRLDFDRLVRATYVCDLMDAVTHDRDCAASDTLFDVSVAALKLLERSDAPLDVMVYAFELRVLAAAGYAPALQECVRCGAPAGALAAGFSPRLGGVLCATHRFAAEDALPLSREALQLLRTLADAAPEELIGFRAAGGALSQAAAALRWFVQTRVDRPLKSAEFLDAVRAASAP